MSIIDHYASAVRSSNLRSQPNTTYSDPDVIGAFGLAGKQEPLGVALARVLMGDNKAAKDVVGQLADMTRSKFHHLKQVQAEDMARAVLAWNRHGVCPECSGHGYQVIPGSPSLSDIECKACLGTGKVLLHKQFRKDHQDAALWMQGQIEAVQATAGQTAMKCLAPSLEL